MQTDKRHHTSVEVEQFHLRWGHPFQIEQREADWRCQERGLQADRHQDAEPDGVGRGPGSRKILRSLKARRLDKAKVELADRADDKRQHDDGDLDPVEKKSQQEDHCEDGADHPVWTERQTLEAQTNQPVPAEFPQDEGEAGRPDEDADD